MTLISRLLFATMACLLLSNCGLINSALRLAPLAMLLVDNEKGSVREHGPLEVEARGRKVVRNGNYAAKARDAASSGAELVLR